MKGKAAILRKTKANIGKENIVPMSATTMFNLYPNTPLNRLTASIFFSRATFAYTSVDLMLP